MNRVLYHIVFILVAALLPTLTLYAQQTEQSEDEKQKIAEQQRIVRELEQRLEQEEQRLNAIKKDKSTASQRVSSITRQIDSRNKLLSRTEGELSTIERDITRNDSLLKLSEVQIVHERERYAEMVREAYRNYKQNNYITYLFASTNFSDAARRIANIRAVASLRAEKMRRIDSLSRSINSQQKHLSERRIELDMVQRRAETQRKKLQSDVASARAAMKQLSSREQAALRQKMESEEKLDAAIDALRRLTKGNKEGASFSRTTSNLNLPVEGGKVRRYKGNMAEIVGRKGAKVSSIYDGKVVEIKENRISGKYDVFVAHGEYITSYANLDAVSVKKGGKIAKNAAIGVIGSSVNLTTMEPEYKMVFGIYSPNPKETMRASDCFKKR